VQRNMRAFKDRLCPNRKLEHTGIAGIEAVLALCDPHRRLALWAYGAVGPKPLFKESNRAHFVGKLLEELKGADG